MEEIYHECEAFKIEQSKLEEEVSTLTCSLTQLKEDILGIKWDMMQLITNLQELAELAQNRALEYDWKQERPHAKEKQRQ
jgi:hypothetical protein